MTYISEHDSKEERKSDSREDSRVYFLVARHTVSISDFLSNKSVAICVKRCRRFGQTQLLNFRRRSYHLYPLNKVKLLTHR